MLLSFVTADTTINYTYDVQIDRATYYYYLDCKTNFGWNRSSTRPRHHHREEETAAAAKALQLPGQARQARMVRLAGVTEPARFIGWSMAGWSSAGWQSNARSGCRWLASSRATGAWKRKDVAVSRKSFDLAGTSDLIIATGP